MKTYPWFFLVIAILMWNGFLIKRDQELFKAYDQACATLSKSHPDCIYAKNK